MGHRCLVLTAALFVLAPGRAATAPQDEALDGLRVEALLTVGAKYHYGGQSPETGFDCSGLVAHVYERAWGLELPRSVREQALVGKPVRRLRDLEPGDLVFYNTRNSPFSHVGIYVGDGRFVHAPRPGKRVRADRVNNPYWRARFSGARRLTPPE